MNDPFTAYALGPGIGADPHPPRVITADGPPGAGKTRKIRLLITPYLQAGKNVVIAVPRHSLGDEIVAAFAEDGITAAVYRGREVDDPDAEGESMCRDLERVMLIEQAGGRASSDACRYKTRACEFYDVCGYQRQRRLKPDLWIVPHQLLFKKRRGFIPDPDVVVIDESFWAATLHGTDQPYKVPISDLRGERLVLGVPGGTAALREISDKTCTVAACALGRLKRRGLTAAGLVASDFKVAHKLEWGRKIDLNEVLPGAEALPGMPIDHLKDVCKRVKAHNKQVMRLARLWKLLIKTMEATEELSPWIEVRPEPRVERLGEEWTFVLAWRDEIHKSWLVPTILLDATMRPEIVRAFYPQAEIAPAKRFPMPHVQVRQVSNTAFAASKTIPTESAPDQENQRRRNNVKRIQRYIEVRAASVHPGRAVVICQKGLEELLRGAIPENVELAHLNAIRGLNAWEHVALLMVIGRTEPGAQQVERITRALFGCTVAEIAPDEEGNVRWSRISRRIRLANGTATVVENSCHPDGNAEAVRWAICEAELVQAIGRGRGIRRTADNPLQIDILTNIALPMIVNETSTWERLQPTFAQIMAARGAVPLGYADMAQAHDDLFKSPGAAEQALRRENPLQIPIDIYLIGVCRGFRLIHYRRLGKRGPGGRLLYDPARIDPQAWLTERLGEVIVLPAAEPAPRAANAAWRCEWFVPDGPGKLRHCGVAIDPGMQWCPEHIRHAASITGYGRSVSNVSIPFFFGDDAAEAAD